METDVDFTAVLGLILSDGKTLAVPMAIDYFAIIVGVVAGALVACERKLDIVGTVVAGLLTGFGGGIVRDLLMHDEGIYFTQHPELVLICTGICAFVFYFRGFFAGTGPFGSSGKGFFLLDTLSVALFALAGASKAFACGEGIILSVMYGAVTAVGGGALRDVFTGETPAIFKQSNFYAIAGLGGAVVYVLLAAFGCPVVIAGTLCVATVLALRYGSVRFGWKTRAEVDYARQFRSDASGNDKRANGGD
ncbi:MAG: TRIC cation channel family protein [Eggerthellaceae bacterium]|nr:TRIC cation channel family protein [Eggerthellaceae bacterium]